jgi:adenylyltransferase/sulfurtransferase
MPTVQVTSALISALQVQEAIKLIHNQQPAVGKRIACNGLTNNYLLITLQILDECLAHGTYDNIEELPLSANQTTLKELFFAVENSLGKGATLNLGRRFILEIRCRHCGKILPLMRPAHRIFDDELICNDCNEGRKETSHERIESFTPKSEDQTYVKSVSSFSYKDAPEELLNMTLWDLGVPPLHILSASNNGEHKAFELTADCAKVLGTLIST